MILYPEKELEPAKALISLMTVVQENKGKVCSVMDYWEPNKYVGTFTANADICVHKLRDSQQWGNNVSLLDLRKAYQQMHIHKALGPFQTVLLRGHR